jgi:hypothetical protein
MSARRAARILVTTAALLALLGPLATPALAADARKAQELPSVKGVIGPLVGSEGPLGLLLDLADDTLGWVETTAGSLLNLGELVPGSSKTTAFAVRNDTDSSQPLALRVIDLDSDDNGCTAPEAASGDTTCGAGGGELARALHVNILRDPELDGSFESTPVFSGTVESLASGTTLADIAIPAWAEWGYRIETSVPGETGNEMQSDQISFGLRFALGDEDVDELLVTGGDPGAGLLTPGAEPPNGNPITSAPAPSTSPNVVDRLLGTLPVTGAGIAGIVLAGWALSAAGLVARLLGRGRKHQSTSRPEGN